MDHCMQLYGLPTSSSTKRVLTTLYEKEVKDFKLVRVDLSKGEHKTAQHLALQPFGLIPVLKDGDLTIFESRAIARYVALKYEGDGNRELYGGTARERAHVDQWLEVEGQSFHAAASALVYQLGSRPRKGEKPDEAVVTSNLQKLEAVLNVYEAELAARPFLAGHFFSLADLSHLPRTAALVSLPAADSSLPDHQLLGHRLLGGRPNVNAWWARISSRPSWLRVQLEAQASHP